MQLIKKNITLILGISVPVVMILLVAGSVYLPGLFIKPHFNFLYVSGNEYNYGQQQYSVQNGRLVKNDVKLPENQNYYPAVNEAKLYIYDVTENKSSEISFEKAQNLNLDSGIKSPDDFEIVYGNRDDGVFTLFFGSSTDYNARYLKGHNLSKKLNLQLSENSYYYDFRLLGWIK